MHSNNPYIEDYNFKQLVAQFPDLGDFVFINDHGNQTIKFSDNKAVKALNTALLKVDYGIVWELPVNNLCPPIPGRLDYLLHIADLIPKKELRLLDIGTGSNLIYPILGTCHFDWKCIGSEVNPESLKNAQKIIANNSKLSGIELRQQKFKNNIFEGIITSKDFFDVVVCNPPFYKNRTDAERRNQRKVKNLGLMDEEQLNFGGLSNELWYKGGEEAFIKKMALESSNYKDQVQWFTALVSQKDNLKNIKRAINKTKPTDVRVVEMTQGNKISRFVAWTFQ